MRRALILVPLLLVTAWVVYAGAGGSFVPACAPTGREMTVEGIEFVEIGPGWFLMGSNAKPSDLLGRVCGPLKLPLGDPGKLSGEMPVHRVTFPRPFWVAKYEVTNEQYERFDQEHRWRWPGDRDPVVNVGFEDATRYCAWLAEKTGLPVRLPTEAEWEAACRAGSRTEYCYGDDEALLGEYAWFSQNSDGHAHEVGTKKANGWGLHDLHGNVWEWCEDTLIANYKGERYYVMRGGCWAHPAKYCRSAHLAGGTPDHRTSNLGFRPAMDVPEE